MAEIRHVEHRHDVIFFCRGWSDLDKISETGAEWHVDCGDWSKSKPDVEFQYGGRLGELNGMSSQSHVSLSRVLPLGEFIVTISESHGKASIHLKIWGCPCSFPSQLSFPPLPSHFPSLPLLSSPSLFHCPFPPLLPTLPSSCLLSPLPCLPFPSKSFHPLPFPNARCRRGKQGQALKDP